MSYKRVIPRDFFNEAKLLKCLGQLIIAIDEFKVGGIPLTFEFDGGPFCISQAPYDGALWCENFHLYLGGEMVSLFSPYNSKENYPLMAHFRGQDYYVFDESGKFLPNFGWRTT